MDVRKIVVGVDHSEGAARTLRWLAAAVKGGDSEVVAVHCLRPLLLDVFALPPFDFDQWKAQTVEQFEAHWVAPLRDAGVAYRTRVVEFDPAEGLEHVADQEGADLIVVGSHGHGAVMLGTVPSRLIDHPRHPVLVVPASDRPRPMSPGP